MLRPQDADDLFENFSQEIQFIGTWGDVDFLFGVYYYTEDIDTDEVIHFSDDGGAFVDLLFGAPGIAALFPDGQGYDARYEVPHQRLSSPRAAPRATRSRRPPTWRRPSP